MWRVLLVGAVGTGFLARCLRKRPALLQDEEPTENGVLSRYDDGKGSLGLDIGLGLELPTQIFNGEGSQIVGDRKIDPSVSSTNEQASGKVSLTFISSHDRAHVMPSLCKEKAKGLIGYGGKWFGFDGQCSEIRDFQQSEDHGSNYSGLWNMGRTQKRDFRKNIRTNLQKRRKASRHVADRKKLDADIDGQYQQSQVNVAGALCFSYGVGIGVIFMLASGKCENDKLNSFLNQIVGMVQDLKTQLDETKDYLQKGEIPKSCHGEIYTNQQEKAGAAANWMLEKDPEFVGSSFKDNEFARSVRIDEPAQQVTGKVELEAELQVGLEYIQMDFLQSNSKHQRKQTEYSELIDSVDVVDGGLYANGLPGQWSSENKTPFVPLEVFHVDDYGVSPYELDRRLCDVLVEQKEERISELEEELKLTEIELHAKESELQHWKERATGLFELSSGTNSGDDSLSLDYVSFERTNIADGKRQHTTQASLESSAKSVTNSEHEGNSKFQLWSFNHCTESPLESTSDSMEQFIYREETNTHWMN